MYCCVYGDDGQRICPKHVEFYPKNKFEKLAHLVGCIIRMSQMNPTHSGPYYLPKIRHKIALPFAPEQSIVTVINTVHRLI